MPLRYVILWHHDIADPHYDLMFETLPRSDLATWRSPTWPIESAVEVERLKDHRRFYLEYEGDLSDRRGRVDRVGGGSCDVHIGEGGLWTINILTGGTPGRFTIRQIAGEQWIVEPTASPGRE